MGERRGVEHEGHATKGGEAAVEVAHARARRQGATGSRYMGQQRPRSCRAAARAQRPTPAKQALPAAGSRGLKIAWGTRGWGAHFSAGGQQGGREAAGRAAQEERAQGTPGQAARGWAHRQVRMGGRGRGVLRRCRGERGPRFARQGNYGSCGQQGGGRDGGNSKGVHNRLRGAAGASARQAGQETWQGHRGGYRAPGAGGGCWA